MRQRIPRVASGLLSLCAILIGGPLLASDFPSRNITWVVGYAPGGGFDTYSRAVARFMEKHLPPGIHVVVENRPGAASQIAASRIYNAAPDGYTIGIWPMPALYVPQIFDARARYDVRQVLWLGSILDEPMVLAVPARAPYRTLEALRAAPEVRITLTGFSGPEVAAPIAMEALGVEARYITGHSSSSESMLAAMRGEGDAIVSTWGSIRTAIAQKTFEPLLLLGAARRIAEIPQVPTATEVGYPELDRIVRTWRAVGAPPGVPADRAAFLRDALWRTLNDEEFRAWSASSGRDVSPVDADATTEAMMELTSRYDQLRATLARYVR